MKSLFFIALFLLSVLQIRSQNYHKIIDTTNKWNVLEIIQLLCGCDPFTVTHSFTISNNTVFNNQSYKIIIDSLYQNVPGTSDYYYSVNNYGFLREDTLNKKVFFKRDNILNEEILLYDFNIVVADTFKGNNQSLVVLSADSISINNHFNKRIKLKNSYSFNSDTIIWIEGIGSLNGLFYLNDGLFDQNQLLCYWKNNNLLYSLNNPLYQCLFALMTDLSETKTIKDISIFPNPTMDIINFNNIENIAEIAIYDIQGKNIMTNKIIKEKSFIDLKSLSNGIYILQIGVNRFRVIKN